MEREVLLIGTGRMARQYAKVLQALDTAPIVVGRSEASAQKFSEETGVQAHFGGISRWKKNTASVPSRAIIAVNVEGLASAAKSAVRAGCKYILLEKPGGLSKRDIISVGKIAGETGATIHIAYNRRYLASTLEAKKIIKRDGGPTSFSFTFTERITVRKTLQELGTDQRVVSRWFIANSTHVVDLAFYLGGEPGLMFACAETGPLWDPHPSLFAGSGITKDCVPFSYYANWELPGPWNVEIGTEKRKLILEPLETLKEELEGKIVDVPFDNSLDVTYKPGLYLQTESFLSGKCGLPTIQEQIKSFDWFDMMLKKSQS